MEKIIYTIFGLFLFAAVLILPSVIDTMPTGTALAIIAVTFVILLAGAKLVNRYGEIQ